MAAIGLFIYEILIWDKETNSRVNFDKIDAKNFIEGFIKSKATDQLGQIDERSWRLEPRAATGYVSHGIVHYGTLGISSKIKDSAGKLRYDRKKNDIEEIPLYYQFWLPSSGLKGFAVFQSYSGRSCASVLRTSLTEAFKARFENYRLTSNKIIPTDENSFSAETVNRFWLVQKNVPKDKADLLRDLGADEYELEVSIKPKGRKFLGNFTDFKEKFKNRPGSTAIKIGGIEYDQVYAGVKVGNSTKKVAVIGPSNTSGTIDITDELEFMENGHPTFESIAECASKTIIDFRDAYGVK